MRYTIVLACLFFGIYTWGQGTYTPLNTDSYHEMNRLDIQYGKILPMPHTSVKPYNKKWLAQYAESMYNSNINLSPQTCCSRTFYAVPTSIMLLLLLDTLCSVIVSDLCRNTKQLVPSMQLHLLL